MLRRFSVNFAVFSMFLDGGVVLLCLWFSAAIRPAMSALTFVKALEAPVTLPLQLYVWFPLIWVIIFASLSIYDGRKFLRLADELAALFLATVIASISSAGILYLSYREVSRALFAVFVSITFLVCLFWRVLARIYFRTRPETSPVSRRLLIVGIGPLGQNVGRQIRALKSERLTLIGFVDDGYPGEGPALGGIDDLENLIREHQVTDIIIALPYSEYHKMTAIVGRLEKVPVGIWIALGFFDLALYRMNIEDFAGIPMVDLRASAIDDYQRMIKRAFDLFLGIPALILALPLMALSALMIYLEDGTPILFRQKRVGENGRLFEMLKFRTMVRNAEQLQSLVEKRDENGNLIHKSKDDPRVTRVGRLLRRFSLDELPQLFNVIAGSMSLVGPRPEMPYLVEKYQPWQRKRFAVPPGLTGWWQISGRSDKPMHLHTEDDLYYIQNYSIWLDLQIIVRTIWVVLLGKGAY
ncbi:MAG TPA: sugar transferase [Anaerolineales bacterium]|nr:sugar transferase [Anaerolineales bacterium]